MVKIRENPMNKWMIWGENPLFLETLVGKNIPTRWAPTIVINGVTWAPGYSPTYYRGYNSIYSINWGLHLVPDGGF